MSFPLFVYPNNWCNFACSYCFTDSSKNKPERSFVIDHWEELIIDAKNSRVTEFRLSGGEPLAVPNLSSMLQLLEQYKMPYSITTNGTYLKRQLYHLASYRPVRIWLSYHPEFMNLNSLKRHADIIKIDLGIPLGLNIFFEDFSDFGNSFAPIASMGADRVKILKKTSIGRHSRVSSKAPLHTDFLLLAQSANENGVECRIEGYAATGYGPHTCVLNSRLLLSIGPDGNAYPCCVVVGDEASCIGNIKETSIQDIVNQFFQTHPSLYCRHLLPKIHDCNDKCPLDLTPTS